MQELRFVAVSEDGSYAVLAVPGRSGRYILPIDERLRAVAQGQTSRLAQYEIEVESPLRPKEIQARIRAGETAEEIADAAGIPIERVRWFEGPVLAERAYIAQQAQTGSVRRAGDSSGPGPRLGDIVTARLSAAGTDPADGQWDSRKRGDGNWQVALTFPSGGRLHVAEWVFDSRRRHVMPDDDNAARLSLPESELPPEPVSLPGEATVTPIASRLGAAAGMGGGGYAGVPGSAGVQVSPGGSRYRPERSVIPDRSLGADRSLVDRPDRSGAHSPAGHPAPSPAPAPSPGPAASPAAGLSSPGQRPGQPQRPAPRDFVEFPESAPYRVPEHRATDYAAPEQQAPDAGRYREPAANDAPDTRPAAYRALAPAQPSPAAPAVPAPPAAGPARAVPAEVTAPAADVPAIDEPERGRLTPARPVVFEEPEPALSSDLLEQAAGPVPAAAVTDRASADGHPAAPVPAAAVGVDAADEAEPVRSAAPEPSVAEPAPAVESAPAVEAVTADETDSVAEPASSAAANSPVAEAAGVASPEPATPGKAAPAAVALEPAPVPEPASSTPAAPPEPPVAAPAAAAKAAPEPKEAEVAMPVTEQPAAEAPVPAAVSAASPVPAPAEPSASEESGRQRGGSKKNAKGRRSSVPSWDEVMLGSSRQRE